MKIALTITTDMKALSKEIEKNIELETIKHLSKVLNRAVELVRTKMLNEAYQDHTGNLNSSTGFLIYKDGKVVHEDFRLSDKGTDRESGLKKGRSVAFSVLRENSGWGVVLVSGEEYASWVQSRGYEVVLGATTGLDSKLKQAFNEIGVIK
ncbi:hypothetical protein ORI89_17410 [Sphingobacterium sp. UT-1RO-CII-1]|uniref:hypothetical protein n=1 Tax=Sphingobacterium sp. UT-1RO-CII-1 TaxID=2995225 RepID=UPI00227B99BC|nr:hypothetical protein [Sphingobacterium sp. UT-1RO-CII-1]MCY4781441.1 hypothetical protein [Sphingobacterium sp. UT-1RO-CII-1]